MRLFGLLILLVFLAGGIADGQYYSVGKTGMPVNQLGGYRPVATTSASATATATVSVAVQEKLTRVYHESTQIGGAITEPAPQALIVPVVIAPPEQQRNGVGADGVQLFYDASLVNILFETAFVNRFGQVADDFPTKYTGVVKFNPPLVMGEIAQNCKTMTDLLGRNVAATAQASRGGNVFAAAVAGSGPTVVAEGNQVLDTQWVVIIDSSGRKYSDLYTRVNNEFWLVNPQ